MFNVKNASLSALAGFVLSFFISIVSTGKPLVSFVRGIVCAALFAGLSCAVDFVSGKFLDQGGKSLDSGEEPEKKPSARPGSVVNITIDDEDFTEEDQAPSFDISAVRAYAVPAAKPPVQEDSVPEGSEAQEPAASSEKEETAAAGAEVPAAERAPVQTEPVAPKAESAKKEAPPAKSENADRKAAAQAEHIAQVQEIDSLPDIGVLSDSSDTESGGSIISSSDFAQTENELQESSPSGSPESLGHDTKTIASAIRTLLKKDEM